MASEQTHTLTAEQQRLVDLVTERAQQACRYALKHQQFGDSDPEFRSGWEVAVDVCQDAIPRMVRRHIAEDFHDTRT